MKNCILILSILAFLFTQNLVAQTNVALNKKATQSSTDHNAPASKAVDGNTNGDYSKHSLTHTKEEEGPWWQVDLENFYQINQIKIYNRTDCCSDRLKHFKIILSDHPFPSNLQTTYLSDRQLRESASKVVTINEATGRTVYKSTPNAIARYIRIQIIGKNYLNIAEVEVMGQVVHSGHTLHGKPWVLNHTYLDLEKQKAHMKNLGKSLKQGQYFSSAQIPVELAEFQRTMLEAGNICRRDPNYRKKYGEKYPDDPYVFATDLSGTETIADVKNGKPVMEKIYKNNPTPPYFDDHVLQQQLNEAAQYQAEYMASIRKMTHDGPDIMYNGYNMKSYWNRAEAFGYKGRAAEAVGAAQSGNINIYPMKWAKGNSHYGPWFNVDSDSHLVGYGIAKADDGWWHFVAVIGRK